jgi:V8-like Glu-specific endopeptidase
VTAAHNLADYPFNSLVRVDVTCGERMVRDDLARVSVIGRRSITNRRFVPRYTYSLTNKFKKFRNDYAFLDLGKTITESLSLNIPIQPKNLAEGTTVFLAGYPGEEIGDGNTLFIGSGAVQKIIPPLVSYGVYTATGNSGGPLWIQDNDQKNYLVGVHVYSSGVRYIDHTFLADWKNWIETRRAN